MKLIIKISNYVNHNILAHQVWFEQFNIAAMSTSMLMKLKVMMIRIAFRVTTKA